MRSAASNSQGNDAGALQKVLKSTMDVLSSKVSLTYENPRSSAKRNTGQPSCLPPLVWPALPAPWGHFCHNEGADGTGSATLTSGGNEMADQVVVIGPAELLTMMIARATSIVRVVAAGPPVERGDPA